MGGVNMRLHRHHSLIYMSNIALISYVSNTRYKLILTCQVFQIGKNLANGIREAAF